MRILKNLFQVYTLWTVHMIGSSRLTPTIMMMFSTRVMVKYLNCGFLIIHAAGGNHIVVYGKLSHVKTVTIIGTGRRMPTTKGNVKKSRKRCKSKRMSTIN